MANLKNVIYLSNEDYETLVSTGTVTIDGDTLTYDENNVYITPDKLASTTEDGLMSSSDKVKLDGIQAGAEANVQSDWSVTDSSSDAYIKNKPSIPDDSNLVHKTGDETISGDKTFKTNITTWVNENDEDKIVLSTNSFVGNLHIWNDAISESVSFGWSGGNPNTAGIFYSDGTGFSGLRYYYVPETTGILAVDNTVSKYQSSSVVVGNAVTNINGRVFQNYTATLVTSGGYTFYQILKNGNNPTEAEAKEYMKYMTGSEFLPKYNYDFPKQTIFTFADRSTWKPQYSSSDGLRLYRLTTPLALESEIPTNLENGSTTGSLEQVHDGSSFTFVNPNSPLNNTSVSIGIATGTYAIMLGGKGRVEGKRGFVNGTQVVATGNYSHAEGNNTHASGVNSHAEGSQTMSSGNASHSEGTGTLASGNNSHAFGNSTIASGYNSIAGGEYSKAEQDNTFSLGYYSYVGNTDQQYTVPSGGGGGSGGGTVEQSTTKSYAIGDHTQALGSYAFVGGYYSKVTANGQGSFVYGSQCTANALDSAAIGEGLTTNNASQFVCGRFNSVRNNTLFEVGNGTSSSPSNALEVFADGTARIGSTGNYSSSIATKGYVDSKENLIEITWSNLKSLRDNSQLIPGRFYRITDYTCTTTQANTSSANHPFDIIVRADSTNKLNEEASAILHSGDTYFVNNNLSAWKLWYCLDNDTTRFAWADSTNGKGVIYRMIDEFNNDIPYDFKNILFTKSGKYTNAYTFSYTEDSEIKDASILGLSKICYYNIMKKLITSNRQELNFNVFYSTSINCTCNFNIFGKNCSNNIFGNSCENNTFGIGFGNNTFGNDCRSNTFGNGCSNNTFGSSCSYNKFGDGCFYNTFGSECSSNTFGSSCYYNKFGDSSSTMNNYKYNIIDDGCCFLYIVGNGTASKQLQNIHIHLGVKGKTSSSRKTITVDRNLAYETNIVPAGTTTIEV